jgi:hypothetical protein
MSKDFLSTTYTFTPGASGVGTVDLSGISSFDKKYLVSIINQTKGVIIYATGSSTLKYTNVAGTVVTLFYDTSTMSSGDTLQVVYQENSEKTSLSSIDSKTPALVSGRQPVDGSGVTQPISAVTLPLPSGASTSALQTSSNTKLDSLLTELQLKADLTETQPVSLASIPLASGAATSALQTTGNTSLSSINTKIPSLGQTTKSGSQPVTLASDQDNINVTLAALTYPSSTGNNIAAQLTSGAIFTGTIESIANQQAAQIEVVCDQPYKLDIIQYIDLAGTQESGRNTYYRGANEPLDQNITLPGNYFAITLKNLGPITTTTLKVDITFGIMDTVPRSTAFSPLLGTDEGLPVRIAPQMVIKTSFANVFASSWDSSFWDRIFQGTGQVNSQSAGNGVITSGTTANQETILRSKKMFFGSFLLRAQVVLSQRIAQNNFFVEAVDVLGDQLSITVNSSTSVTVTIPNNPYGAFTSANVGQFMNIGALTGFTGVTSVPGRYVIASVSGNNVTFTVAGWATGSVNTGTCSVFGYNYHANLYDSTTATNSKYDTQRNGWNTGNTTATINTTASPGHMMIIGAESGNCLLADQLVASSTSNPVTQRASRVVNIPGEEIPLFLQIRCLNGTSNPASTTTFTCGSISVENYTPLPVSMTSTRPQSQTNVQQVAVTSAPSTTVTASNLSCNIAQVAGNTPNTSTMNGSTNRALGVIVSAAGTNTDYSAQAWAAASGNGATIAPANGDGQSCSFSVNVTTFTAGSSTGLYVYLQESPDNGTTWTDIWGCEPFTTTGFARIPAIPIGGRRRMRWVNRAGAATTATVTVIAISSPSAFVTQRQFFDWGTTGTAANSLLITGAAQTTSTSTITSALNTTGQNTAAYPIDGCKVLSLSAVVSAGTAVVAPVITLEVSNDFTNWYTTATTLTLPLVAGGTSTTVTNIVYKYARAKLTTAQSGGTPVALTYIAIQGVN